MQMESDMKNGFNKTILMAMPLVLLVCLGAFAGNVDGGKKHGLVGLRPLPRFEADLKSSHGGPWAGLPTYVEQKGNYPFVAEHIDVVKGWLDGTKANYGLLFRPAFKFRGRTMKFFASGPKVDKDKLPKLVVSYDKDIAPADFGVIDAVTAQKTILQERLDKVKT